MVKQGLPVALPRAFAYKTKNKMKDMTGKLRKLREDNGG